MKTLFAILVMTAFTSNLSALERLEPPDRSYFGFTLDKGETIADLSSRLGFTPAVYSRFFAFPLTSFDHSDLLAFLDQVRSAQAIAMLTLEPSAGLETVTAANCNDLATLCATAESRGQPGIFIRFAHEMNGNWYPWGQRPTLHKAAFRMMSLAIHARTARTAMVWAPNYGVGYPFTKPVPARGSADFAALDTNGDGRITDRDDPYAPYYPGDDAVDWVGMTIYHWGVNYPWFENEMPSPDNFAGSLQGTYQGKLPNFYAEYCVNRGKPLMIPETAAFYNTEQPGPDPLLMKQAWWRQVFAATSTFPKLKCINWFDELKRETEARNSLIDWRVSADPRIRTAFVRDFFSVSANGHSEFLTADDVPCLTAAYCISAASLPNILPQSGDIAVSLNVRAAAHCDLVIDLLDSKYNWQGGTRVRINSSIQNVTTGFHLVKPLTDQTSYRWSIFLTPIGADYHAALAWYTGPNPSDDPDGDGASNDAEFAAGTNPRNPLDVLALNVEQEGSGVVLTWPSKVGKQYEIVASTDLTSWSPASPVLQGTGQPIRFPVKPAQESQFVTYRLKLVP